MRFKKLIKPVALLLCLILAFTTVKTQASAAPKNEFVVTVTVGYTKTIPSNCQIPVTVTIQNKGDDFDGSVWLILPENSTEICSYEKKLQIASGAVKEFTFIISPAYNYSTVTYNIVITDKKNKNVSINPFPVEFMHEYDTYTIGLLSEDYNAMNFIGGTAFSGFPRISPVIVRLNEKNIYEDYHALDSFDSIIIADYSTNRLSDKQIAAINEWVKNGGTLMLCMGETAGKTLSGFDNLKMSFSDSLTKVNTTFGLKNATFTYPYFLDGNISTYEEDLALLVFGNIDMGIIHSDEWSIVNEAPAIADYDLKTKDLYNKMYSDNEQLFLDVLLPEMWGIDSYELSKTYDSLTAQSIMDGFEEEVKDRVIPQLVKLISHSTYSAGPVQSYEPVLSNISMLPSGTEIIAGDIAGGNSSYSLLTASKYGEGQIAFVAFDPTKEPFVSYSSKGPAFINIIETLCNKYIYDSYKSYNSTPNAYIYSYERTFFNGLTVPRPVPLIPYIIILSAFSIAGFLFWFRLKKHKKTLLYWYLQPAFAVIGAVLIIISGTLTRITKPVVTSARFVYVNNNATQVKTYASVLVPKSKKYTINFNTDSRPMHFTNNSYYYGDHFALLPDKAGLSYLDESGSASVLLNSKTALSQTNFSFDETGLETGASKVIFKPEYSNGVLSGYVENLSGHDLSDCIAVFDACVCKIGDLKNGQRKELSDCTLEPNIISKPSDAFAQCISVQPLSVQTLGADSDKEVTKHMLGLKQNDFVKKYLKTQALCFAFNCYGLEDYSLSHCGNTTDYYINYKTYNNCMTDTNLSGKTNVLMSDFFAYMDLNEDRLPYSSNAPTLLAFNRDNTSSVLKEGCDASEELTELWIISCTE